MYGTNPTINRKEGEEEADSDPDSDSDPEPEPEDGGAVKTVA